MDAPADVPLRPGLAQHKLWSVAAIVYGSLALLLAAMPNQVASRLVDLGDAVSLMRSSLQPAAGVNATWVPAAVHGLEDAVTGLQNAVNGLAGLSDRVGIEGVYENLRARFQALVPHGSGG